MSDKQEETVRFQKDGPEFKVSELSPEVLNLLERYNKKKEQRDTFVLQAQETLDDYNRLLDSLGFSAQEKAQSQTQKTILKEVKDVPKRNKE